MTDDKKNQVSAVAWLLRGIPGNSVDTVMLKSAAGKLIQSVRDDDDVLLESVMQFLQGFRAGLAERTIVAFDTVVHDAVCGAVVLLGGKL